MSVLLCTAPTSPKQQHLTCTSASSIALLLLTPTHSLMLRNYTNYWWRLITARRLGMFSRLRWTGRPLMTGLASNEKQLPLKSFVGGLCQLCCLLWRHNHCVPLPVCLSSTCRLSPSASPAHLGARPGTCRHSAAPEEGDVDRNNICHLPLVNGSILAIRPVCTSNHRIVIEFHNPIIDYKKKIRVQHPNS